MYYLIHYPDLSNCIDVFLSFILIPLFGLPFNNYKISLTLFTCLFWSANEKYAYICNTQHEQSMTDSMTHWSLISFLSAEWMIHSLIKTITLSSVYTIFLLHYYYFSIRFLFEFVVVIFLLLFQLWTNYWKDNQGTCVSNQIGLNNNSRKR